MTSSAAAPAPQTDPRAATAQASGTTAYWALNVPAAIAAAGVNAETGLSTAEADARQDDLHGVLVLLVLGLFTAICNILAGSFIGPIVYGRAVNLHPAIVTCV